MKYIGAHVSTQGGIFNAPLRAQEIGARSFAFFTKNQRKWTDHDYSPAEIQQFKENLQRSGIDSKYILAHASYLINLGSPDELAWRRSVAALIDEAKRCEQLGVAGIVVHPGSHLHKISEAESLTLIGAALNQVIAATQQVRIVVENTAGQGGNLGYCFEHLGYLMDLVVQKERIGVCIDTCHLWAAGYDFTNREKYAAVWQQFDQLVGRHYLAGLHLNDSKMDLGTRVDRHDSIGVGKLGLVPFGLIMQDSRLDDLPMILETIDSTIWPEEIALLYNLAG